MENPELQSSKVTSWAMSQSLNTKCKPIHLTKLFRSKDDIELQEMVKASRTISRVQSLKNLWIELPPDSDLLNAKTYFFNYVSNDAVSFEEAMNKEALKQLNASEIESIFDKDYRLCYESSHHLQEAIDEVECTILSSDETEIENKIRDYIKVLWDALHVAFHKHTMDDRFTSIQRVLDSTNETAKEQMMCRFSNQIREAIFKGTLLVKNSDDRMVAHSRRYPAAKKPKCTPLLKYKTKLETLVDVFKESVSFCKQLFEDTSTQAISFKLLYDSDVWEFSEHMLAWCTFKNETERYHSNLVYD